jgi:hypothetical protein
MGIFDTFHKIGPFGPTLRVLKRFLPWELKNEFEH